MNFTTTQQKLAGKMALITGGTSGIGLATAKRWAQEGARVAITGQNSERLAEAARELPSDTLALRADVRSIADMMAVFAQLRQQFGHLDILFVNAGIAFPTLLEMVEEKQFNDIFDVNVKGAFFTVQKAVPLMRAGGSIILNTSWLNEVGTPGLSVLSASKAAVRSFARSLSAELASRGLRVNAVSPGAIATPIYNRMGLAPEQVQVLANQIQGQIPLGRFGNPEEIAAAALFLASDDSTYMLGAEVVVDGGLSQL